LLTNRKQNINFYAVLAAYIAVVFFVNRDHINQQGIFFNQYLPIAKNLLNGTGYIIHSGVRILYPIWGYTFLTMMGEIFGSPVFFLAVVQSLLCIFAISFFYKFFNLQKRYWHIPLLTPFIALTSVRWPDAIVGILLIIAAYYYKQSLETRSNKYAILSGLILGTVLNFRSEYLGLILLLGVIAFAALILKERNLFSLSALTVIPALLVLLPWAYYSYSIDNHIRLTATNAGGVLYISLGQLPNNPWGIVHSDSVAYEISKQNGISDPYSANGDSLLTAKFIGDVENNPIAYSEKTGYNLITSLIRGVYIGEYTGPIQKIVKIVFILLFDLLLLVTCLYFSKHYGRSPLFFIVAVLVVYKFLLISFIQYEPRHMNAIYLFLLGSSLLYFEDRISNKKSKQ
jgi:hypothetical protein